MLLICAGYKRQYHYCYCYKQLYNSLIVMGKPTDDMYYHKTVGCRLLGTSSPISKRCGNTFLRCETAPAWRWSTLQERSVVIDDDTASCRRVPTATCRARVAPHASTIPTTRSWRHRSTVDTAVCTAASTRCVIAVMTSSKLSRQPHPTTRRPSACRHCGRRGGRQYVCVRIDAFSSWNI